MLQSLGAVVNGRLQNLELSALYVLILRLIIAGGGGKLPIDASMLFL